MELAHADKEKLRKFIRMIDYMTIETLVKVNLQSMIILYDEMQRENRKIGALFNSMVRFDPDGISFSPDDKEIAENLQGILTDMIKVASNTQRILHYVHFENIVKTTCTVDVFNIISNSV